MNQATLWQAYNKLPTDAKQIVDELITILVARYQSVQSKSRKRLSGPKRLLTEEPFIGMWKAREDMTDSTRWLRAKTNGQANVTDVIIDTDNIIIKL